LYILFATPILKLDDAIVTADERIATQRWYYKIICWYYNHSFL